jgi:hypothetical protein
MSASELLKGKSPCWSPAAEWSFLAVIHENGLLKFLIFLFQISLTLTNLPSHPHVHLICQADLRVFEVVA